jgi:hypothetical protein
MASRIGLGALVAALLAVQSGCCCWPKDPPWPCGNTYYGNQCGCKYWHEWFSHKPPCCEPCNECGHFVGSLNPYVESGPPYTRYGALYSDGSGSNAPGAIGELYPGQSGPTPAAEPNAPSEPAEGVFDEAAPETAPVEELPGPTTRAPRGAPPRMAGRYGPVDSAPYSRTLGRPPRTGLFTR